MTRRKFRSPSALKLALVFLVGLLIFRLPDAVNEQAGTIMPASIRVTRVIDGDTIELADGRRIRLLGIDAPELGRNGSSAEAGAEASRDWLRQRIEGALVTLRYGPRRLDGYGRTLAWVLLPGGELINRALLESGHARLVTRFGLPADLSAELHSATARARVARRGIWSKK